MLGCVAPKRGDARITILQGSGMLAEHAYVTKHHKMPDYCIRDVSLPPKTFKSLRSSAIGVPDVNASAWMQVILIVVRNRGLEAKMLVPVWQTDSGLKCSLERRF